MNINIHNIIPISEVNGPGKRFTFWVQGCDRNCISCFNPETHSFEKNKNINTDILFNKIISQQKIEGISISGGEPFAQAEALLELLIKLKKQTSLSVLIFTGYTLTEIQNNTIYKKLLNYIDILVAGPYVDELKTNHTLLSSSNQQVHFFTQRYDYKSININNCEIIIDKKGIITLTGCTNFKE